MKIVVQSNNKKIQPIPLPIIRETYNVTVKENVDEMLRLAQVEIEQKLDGIMKSGEENKKTGTYGKPELVEFARRLKLPTTGNKPDIVKRITDYFKDLKLKRSQETYENSTIIWNQTRQQVTGLF